MLYGLHQIFTKIAAPHVSEGLGGFIVEIAAAASIGLYMLLMRFHGAAAEHGNFRGFVFSALTGVCVDAILAAKMECRRRGGGTNL